MHGLMVLMGVRLRCPPHWPRALAQVLSALRPRAAPQLDTTRTFLQPHMVTRLRDSLNYFLSKPGTRSAVAASV